MLNFLADYTEYHFNEEEALQESINYPGIKEHKDVYKRQSLPSSFASTWDTV